MIPMSCPNCGSQGEVPLDRLNRRLKCKKCGTIFYMDETGSIVLGDPNATGKKKGRRKKADAGPAVDLDLGRMIRDIPKPLRIGAPILVAVAAFGYGIASLLGSMGVPDDVEGRTEYVGELFIDNRVDALRTLAMPGTEDDLARWHETMRPKLNYEGARRNSDDVQSSAAVMSVGGSSARSFVSVVVIAPAAAMASPGASDGPMNTLTMSLSWGKADGQWLVDGTGTLNSAVEAEAKAAQGRRE